MSDLVTRAQAAELLKLKPHTLFFWERRQILKPFTHVGGRPRYRLIDIAEAATTNNNFKQKK